MGPAKGCLADRGGRLPWHSGSLSSTGLPGRNSLPASVFARNTPPSATAGEDCKWPLRPSISNNASSATLGHRRDTPAIDRDWDGRAADIVGAIGSGIEVIRT